MRIIYNKIINEYENNGFTEWPFLKSLQITNASEGVAKREPFYTVGGNVSWCSHCGKQYGCFSKKLIELPSVQFSSVAQSCPTLCDPMNHSTPGLPVHHQLLEFTQPHIHWVSDAIQPSHLLSSPSPPAPNPSQHQGPFQSVSPPHEVAKVLELQL